MKCKTREAEAALSRIRVLVLDVDGVLTEGQILYLSSGEEIKSFNAKDGAGLKYWARAGHAAAFLTGRASPVVERRAEELGVGIVEMGAKDKMPALERILHSLQLSAEECAYVGDDLPDLPVIRAVGLGIAVADAVREVKDGADAVTELTGGRGAVREVVETILRAQGRWDGIIMKRYLPGATHEAIPEGEA